MEYFEKLTLEIMSEKTENFKFSEDSYRYIESYPIFISFFKEINRDLEKKDIVIASHFVYGWMPTILKHTNITDEHLKLLNQIKHHQYSLNEDELASLTQVTNNSVVGLSKLLHFIAPDLYPIWDSNICFYLTNKKHQANNLLLYKNYWKQLKEITESSKYDSIHKCVCKKIKSSPNISRLRSCEMILFELGKLQNQNSSSNK